MKTTSVDTGRIKLYLWAGLVYAFLWLVGHTATFEGSFLQNVWNNLWRVVYVLFFNFLFFEYTVPFILQKRRFVLYNVILGFGLLWLHLIVWSFGLYAWRLVGVGLGLYTPSGSFTTTGAAIEAQMAYSAGSVFFFGVIRHLYHYVKLKQAAQQLRIQKQEAELNYLRSQTNPHFLFNTLNNIYALSRDKSDLAPESIMRLSKILRYMLYETGDDYIALEQELKIICDYIALEKLRYDESLRINFNTDVEDQRQAVPPLLLMPLVENAFKHGVSETRTQPFVTLHLSVKQRQLVFTVKNSADTEPGKQGVKENIGLSNLRRQLELLYTDYNLSVQQEAHQFTAVLKINLASHV